ncbi:MAG: TolC family protein [Bryobacteraceae bacterium]
MRIPLSKVVLCVLAAPPLLMAQSGPVLELSLKQAIEAALSPEGNARVRLAQQAVQQASSRTAQARSSLMPNLDGSISQQNQTRNLAAFGIRINIPLPGFQFPTLAGPFNVFDVRASATQTLFDFSAIRRFQSARTAAAAAGQEQDAVRDEVARQTALLYLAALRAQARLDAAQADVELAQSLATLAANQKAAGTGTAIEVTRAAVQLAQARQQLLLAHNDLRQSHLQLLRAIGLPLDVSLRLTTPMDELPVEKIPLDKAIEAALANRADWKAQQTRQRSAALAYSAIKYKRLPSLTGFADYGSIGSSVHNAIPTRTYGLAMRVPVFDGGRRDARRAESHAQLEMERIRTADLRRQIELEIRLALDELESAAEQVKVAREGLAQVQAELEQAERRYKAGVATSLEVTDAQTRLARARENQIAALFLYNRARLDLLQATGKIRELAN